MTNAISHLSYSHRLVFIASPVNNLNTFLYFKGYGFVLSRCVKFTAPPSPTPSCGDFFSVQMRFFLLYDQLKILTKCSLPLVLLSVHVT